VLGRAAVSYQVVRTKCDAVKSPELADRITEIEAALVKRAAAFPGVLATSAHEATGVAGMRGAIARRLAERDRATHRF
jgi:GTP-binding protein